jgi:hypothetical protein
VGVDPDGDHGPLMCDGVQAPSLPSFDAAVVARTSREGGHDSGGILDQAPMRSRSARPVGARSCPQEIRSTDHSKDTTVGHLTGQTGLLSAPGIIAVA